jgi:hypothetical protein
VSGPLLLAGWSFHRTGIVWVTAASERAINLAATTDRVNYCNRCASLLQCMSPFLVLFGRVNGGAAAL